MVFDDVCYVTLLRLWCLCKSHLRQGAVHSRYRPLASSAQKVLMYGLPDRICSHHFVCVVHHNISLYENGLSEGLQYILYGLSLKNCLSFLFSKFDREIKLICHLCSELSLPWLVLVFPGSSTGWLINDHSGAIRPGRYRLSWVVGWTLIAVLGTLRRKHP